MIQTMNDIKDVIATNDATIQGILLGVIIALGSTTIYLYKQVQKLQREYIEEIRKTNVMLIEVNKSYNQFTSMMREMIQKN